MTSMTAPSGHMLGPSRPRARSFGSIKSTTAHRLTFKGNMNILAIDVGGTHVKVLATGHRKPVEIPSGPKMTSRQMVKKVRAETTGWRYSVVSIGYPGPVLHGKPVG